ncbi:MAG: TSUP family transporter [Gammaproteobacteria bacterium]
MSLTLILLACPVAFLAGLVDAIAGGGGLIQVPGLLILFPQASIVSLLGTNKLASCCGTAMSSFHYTRTLKIDYRSFAPTLIAAFIGSFIGAKVVSSLQNEVLKPVIFVLLLIMGIYTLIRKDFGLISRRKLNGLPLQLCSIAIGAGTGFYDGFFGPGTGSLLMFFLVGLIGYNFLEGSAFAKLANLAANAAALIFFATAQKIFYSLAIPMAAFNVLGNLVGAKLAIKKGSGFVRWIFLVVITGVLIQLLWQVLVPSLKM